MSGRGLLFKSADRKLKIVLKSDRDLAAMRKAGRLVAQTLEALKEQVRPGVSTAELDRFAHDYVTRRGGRPSFKGYHGYPASLCTSIKARLSSPPRHQNQFSTTHPSRTHGTSIRISVTAIGTTV